MKRTPIFAIEQLIGIFLVGTVLARGSFVSPTPESGAKLDVVPETIMLMLREELSDKRGFTIVDASGATASEGAIDVNDLGRKTLGCTLSTSTTPDAYTVNEVVLSTDDNHEKSTINFTLAFTQATAEPRAEPTPVPTDALTVVPPLAPTPVQGTVTPVEPTVLIIDSPTNPGGPTLVNDDGARIGRMIALIVVLVTIVGLTAAVVFTRRHGGEQ
jgi:methionine-rich copper-binding protein CopC